MTAPVLLGVTVGVEAHTSVHATAHEDQKFGLSLSGRVSQIERGEFSTIEAIARCVEALGG